MGGAPGAWVGNASDTPADIPDLLCSASMSAGALIVDRRRAHGLTQARLALRAGTTQGAISRLERDAISPTFDTVERLLAAMGETLDAGAARPDADFDRDHLADLLARSPANRLELAISWNRLAGEIAIAGRRARDEPPP
jgi:transcriptional regulator with XRE-family HTH domain